MFGTIVFVVFFILIILNVIKRKGRIIAPIFLFFICLSLFLSDYMAVVFLILDIVLFINLFKKNHTRHQRSGDSSDDSGGFWDFGSWDSGDSSSGDSGGDGGGGGD